MKSKTLKSLLKSEWKKYLLENGKAPTFANVSVRFHNEKNTQDVFIKLNLTVNDDDDDYIFHQDMDMNELAKYAEAFSERVKSGDLDDEFLEGMDQVMEYTMKEKGFDINTLSGAKAAQKFLENARVEDAFITEGPIDNAVDWHMGEARLDAMLKCVKARIQKMINKN